MYPARSSYRALNLPNELSLENFDAGRNKSDKKMFAPVELLTQFLSTIMQKDYSNALVFCKLIQQFEPTNATANSFYPMIIKKLRQKPIHQLESSSDDEEDDDFEDEIDLNQDSGIEKEGSSTDDDSDEEEEETAQKSQKVHKKPLNHLEAQKEIVKHLRSRVVPNASKIEASKLETSKNIKKK